MHYLSLSLFLLIAAASCQSIKTTSTAISEATPQDVLNDIWVLEMVDGKPVNTADYMRELPRLEFRKADGKVIGTTGCNSIGGSYTAKNGKLSFSPLVSTRMACPGDGEHHFLSALNSVDSYKIKDLTLFLMQGTEVKLQFKKAD
ncbi:MAG: META domain-containing protein [Cyclobacteriaceae bacterium]|nr:META domain-containing protein [Cyclobacteriaceae bacterium]